MGFGVGVGDCALTRPIELPSPISAAAAFALQLSLTCSCNNGSRILSHSLKEVLTEKYGGLFIVIFIIRSENILPNHLFGFI